MNDSPPFMPADTGPARRQAWLDQLRIMNELPYPSVALIPSIISVMRGRLDAVLGCYVWMQGERPKTDAFWAQATDGADFERFKATFCWLSDETRLRRLIDSDGECIWQAGRDADFRGRATCTSEFESMDPRRICCIPTFCPAQAPHGILCFYRAIDRQPFGMDEQAILRRVRAAVGPLDRGDSPYNGLPPAPRRPVARARLVFSREGQLNSRGRGALTVLFLASGARTGRIDWEGFDTQALCASIQMQMQDIGGWYSPRGTTAWAIDFAYGTFEFVAERLSPVVDSAEGLQWLVTVTHLEPQDLTLARCMACADLSPQAKRILLASTRDTNVADVAAALNITQGSLKSYINEILQKHRAATRRELVDRFLSQPACVNSYP